MYTNIQKWFSKFSFNFSRCLLLHAQMHLQLFFIEQLYKNTALLLNNNLKREKKQWKRIKLKDERTIFQFSILHFFVFYFLKKKYLKIN